MYNIIWKSFSIRQNSDFDLRNSSNIKPVVKSTSSYRSKELFSFSRDLVAFGTIY